MLTLLLHAYMPQACGRLLEALAEEDRELPRSALAMAGSGRRARAAIPEDRGDAGSVKRALLAPEVSKRYGADGSAPGGEPRGRRGGAGRASRPERSREVDPDQDRLRPRPAHVGRDRGGGHPAGSAQARGRSATWPSSSGFRLDERRELLTLHQRLAGSGGGRRRGSSFSTWSVSPTRVDPGRRDVEGHAAAARNRPGTCRRPRLLLLDEPTSALDPVGRRSFASC